MWLILNGDVLAVSVKYTVKFEDLVQKNISLIFKKILITCQNDNILDKLS